MGKSDAEDIEFWDYDEYKKFENVIEKDSMDYIIFKLLYYTGVRIGELLALHRSDIIWDSNEISINKTVNKGNGVELYTSPKTVSSKRKVSVPSALMRELKEYVDRIYDSEEDVVLFPICDRTVAKHLKKYIDVAKVKEIHTHCLRHSHVALLISKGEDIYIISKRLGHKDIKTTMNTYGHLYPNADKDMAERLNELV
jgi:integrase